MSKLGCRRAAHHHILLLLKFMRLLPAGRLLPYDLTVLSLPPLFLRHLRVRSRSPHRFSLLCSFPSSIHPRRSENTGPYTSWNVAGPSKKPAHRIPFIPFPPPLLPAQATPSTVTNADTSSPRLPSSQGKLFWRSGLWYFGLCCQRHG